MCIVFKCVPAWPNTPLVESWERGRFSWSLFSPGTSKQSPGYVTNRSIRLWRSDQAPKPRTNCCLFHICISGVMFIFLFSALSDHINVLYHEQPSPQIMTILYFTLFWFLVIQIHSGRWTCLSVISRPCLAVKMNKWADWQWAHTSTCS